MSTVPQARDTIAEHGMDGLASNQQQALLLFNATAEPDSAIERLIIAARVTHTDPDKARRMILEALDDLKRVHGFNKAERVALRAICAEAEQIGRNGLSVKDAAAELRAPLATLINPILVSQHPEARRLVLDVLDRSRPGLLFDPQTGRIGRGLDGELNSPAKVSAFEAITRGVLGVTA
jgi:hypothetical protein